MSNKSKQWGAIIIMIALFAMIAFVTNLCSPMAVIVKNQFGASNLEAQIGNYGNFIAYLIMGIPSGMLIKKFGYKATALMALVVGIIGIFVQWMSGWESMQNAAFAVYLVGAFIAGFCMCMLNTVVNPMLNILGGGGNKGNQLIQTGGALNSLSGTMTPLFVGSLIGMVTAQTSMSDVAPLLWIAMGVFAFAFIVLSFVAIPEPHMNKGGKKVKFAHSPWHFRHTVFGVVGIFFYVGIEIGIPGVLNFYLSDSSASGILVNASAIAGAVVAIYWLLMLVGRLLSSAISGAVSSRAQLIFVSTLAIVLIIAAIFLPDSIRVSMPGYSVADGFTMAEVPMKALLFVLCGLCTSVMWGGIFNLAVEGLGKYTAQASGIFMMMVVGGGVMPVIQNAIANSLGYMTSYWLVVAMLAYLLFYGLIGCKNVNKDIPVDDEAPDARNL